MKSIFEASSDLDTFANKLINKLTIKQEETAKKIWEDVIARAPVSSGDYLASIQVSKTEYNDKIIHTSVFTDLTSNDNSSILIGRLIENGTGIYALEPHIGKTKTFLESGYRYWYVPATSVKSPIGKSIFIDGKEFYVAYAQPSKPHFKPALDSNIALYHEKIREAVREAKN